MNNLCDTSCPTTPLYYKDIVNNMCVTMCKANTYLNQDTGECVELKNCPAG